MNKATVRKPVQRVPGGVSVSSRKIKKPLPSSSIAGGSKKTGAGIKMGRTYGKR